MSVTGRDVSVCFAVAFFVMYMSNDGTLDLMRPVMRENVSKFLIQERLLFVQRFHPPARPSRVNLNKINLYFMGRSP
jgi:glutathione peroxidase-family protein